MRSGTFLRAFVGAAISIVALWFVLRGVDLARTAEVLSHADLRWIALAAVFSSSDLAFRALRWQRLLRPIASVRYPPMLGYLLIGYLANNVLPARLGELVRSHYLGDREGISRASALGTVVVERVVDLVAVVGIASVALLVLSVRGVVASAVLVGAGVAGLFLVVLALGIVAHRLPGIDRIAAVVERWPQVRELARRLQGGLAVASRPRTLVEALVVSALAWTVAILSWAAVGQSIGLQLSIGQAALIASGVALASAVPAGPSNLGTFELAAVEIGKAIGIPRDSAFALALIVHASILVVTSVGGAVALARIGWVRRTNTPDPVARPG
ncbi:MAG TPA: lysylphosphatidylglycerol synthase transmembrane domain-containing protein [Candidatus Limnocylindrales bacterium]|nr:lysylphosphatidylglycerol synthase transmembrane domain-containing protein [Candidatus Limnocylindrales bacterium]